MIEPSWSILIGVALIGGALVTYTVEKSMQESGENHE